jgi:hypothetical protein
VEAVLSLLLETLVAHSLLVVDVQHGVVVTVHKIWPPTVLDGTLQAVLVDGMLLVALGGTPQAVLNLPAQTVLDGLVVTYLLGMLLPAKHSSQLYVLYGINLSVLSQIQPLVEHGLVATVLRLMLETVLLETKHLSVHSLMLLLIVHRHGLQLSHQLLGQHKLSAVVEIPVMLKTLAFPHGTHQL